MLNIKIFFLIVLASICLMATSTVQAFSNEPLGWDGWEWGKSLDGNADQFHFPRMEAIDSDDIYSFWKGKTTSAFTLDVPGVRYWFYRGRLLGVKIVDLNANRTKWASVIAALEAQYGTPTAVKDKSNSEGSNAYNMMIVEYPDTPEEYYSWEGKLSVVAAAYYHKSSKLVIGISSKNEWEKLGQIKYERRNYVHKDTFAYQNEPDGFRGILWGTSSNNVSDKLRYKKTYSGATGSSGYDIYENPKEDMLFGYGQASKISYCFWQEKFYEVRIDVTSESDWIYLLRALQLKFGYGVGPNWHPIWPGQRTYIFGHYDTKEKTGSVWLNSVELEKVKTEYDKAKSKSGAGFF